jgi:iron(III) transport system ATP-binding protein
MLTVRGLAKRFDGGRVAAVAGVSFDVEEGQFFTLLGPSGCGKTTTLRCLAGLECPDAGEIVLAGRTLFSDRHGIDVRASDRGLGLVFQSYAIWPHMNVHDNVAFPLTVGPRRRRLSKREIRERVDHVLSVVKLDELAARPATDLSGGQQQRLALGRALVMQPPLLLLDEPLSNLDARLREEMRIELKRLQRELNVTAVYVTHDQVEALAMSNTIAIMAEGRIEQIGPPREIYQRPASRFVADFVGGANIIDGVVERREPNHMLRIETTIGPLRAVSTAPYAAAARVLVVVRPEHVTLRANDAGQDGGNSWRGRVLGTGYLGDAVDHVVTVGPLTLRARTAPQASAVHGTEVTVGFAAEDCVLVPGDG